MTREAKQKAIDTLEISSPFVAVTQEEYSDYIQTINQIIDWLEQEPCEDAISRQEVLYLIADDDLSMGQVVKGIHALSSVTPQPRKGHWISTETKGVRYAAWCRYKCSLCGELSEHANFCPNCGADMRGEEE